MCAFSLKCKNHIYRAVTCSLIGQPFILSLQALLNILVSQFLTPFLSPWFLPSCLPFTLSVFSCIQFLISSSLSLSVPFYVPLSDCSFSLSLPLSHSHLLVWLRLHHPRGHVFSVYYRAKEGRGE